MKHYGHIDLQQNQIQRAVMQSENEWPTSPVVGQLLFKDKVVYICVQITGNLPIWVPLTREQEMYIHVQSVAALNWNITHNLNTPFVIVQVYDGNDRVVLPNEITILNANEVRVDFSGYAAGRAVILSGSLDGAQKPTYAVEYQQVTPASSWVITHNLGYAPIVRIFSGSYEIQPSSILHNSPNQVTVSFASAQIGTAKLI